MAMQEVNPKYDILSESPGFCVWTQENNCLALQWRSCGFPPVVASRVEVDGSEQFSFTTTKMGRKSAEVTGVSKITQRNKRQNISPKCLYCGQQGKKKQINTSERKRRNL